MNGEIEQYRFYQSIRNKNELREIFSQFAQQLTAPTYMVPINVQQVQKINMFQKNF